MPFKDGRMTPAEKRAMEKRYGEKEGTYRRSGANYMNEDTPDTYEDRLTKAASNDYDTRKAQETLHLALTDEDYRKSLGKKAQNFVDNYKGSDKKDKEGMLGISNMQELQAVNDFGRLYHKHERNMGGNYSSANDYGGGSMDMMDSMRKHHDRNFALKGENEDAVPEQEVNNGVADPNADLSPEHQQAQDLLSEYTNSVTSGQFTKDLYADPVSADKPQHNENVSQQQTAAENNTSMIDVDAFADKQKSMASMYLDKFKENMSKDMNFQRAF